MELLAKYVYKVYQEKSFSLAAKVLYISQPALSAAVARHERELGFRIFDRTTMPLSLTPEGQVYIDMLEDVMESESVMYHRLQQLSTGSSGTLSIGGTNHVAYWLIPTICGVFHRRYPDVMLKVDMGNVGSPSNLLEKLQGGVLDVLFAYGTNEETQTEIPLLQERFVIVMRRDLLGAQKLAPYAVTREQLLRDPDSCPEIADLSLFREIPFLRFGMGSALSQITTELLGEYRAASCFINNARNGGIYYNMMCAGLGALVTSASTVAISTFPSKDLLFFLPRATNGTRTVCAVLKKGVERAPLVSKFLEVASEVAQMKEKALSLYI